MKNLKIIYFVILFALITLLGVGLVQAQESMTTQLQIVLEDAVNSPETVFPGALLYVSSPDLGAWSGVAGLGNIETETAIRADDKFRAGSIIKPMIAVVILQLVEEGKLFLDDPMTAVLPESVTTKFSYSDQITVRMLLNHTSGIADCIGPAMNEIIADLAKVWETDEWLDVAAAQEPYFAPGEGWMYSNTDYILLGLVIEQATGRSWRESLRERIIEKLNLENTLLPEPGNLSIPGNYAHGYMDLGAGLVDVTEVDPSMADAAGGSALVTTTTDLARFLEAVLAGEFFQNTGTLAEMLTFVDIPEGNSPISGLVGYGLGMMKSSFPDSIEMIGHSGDTAGFSSFTFHLPTQGITISGLVSDMDPSGILSRVLLPALKVLIPEFKPVLTELDPASSALQGLLDQQVKEQDILGMAMAVRLADGTVIGKASGYSDPSEEKTWSVNTLSAIGSVTKTFSGVVVMQLIEEGKLSLDDTINTWFPEQPNGDKVTIRMLLSHTSGIANYISGENVMEGKWTNEWAPMDLVTEANKLGPVSVPGSRESHYSNTNYILLGLIIEKITGNSWAQEVKSRIIEPLDLKDTMFLSTEGVWGGIMVLGYAKTPDGYISSLELPWYPHSSTAWSAGEVVSTVSDLMIFASALFDGKLVSKVTLAIMAQPLGTDVDSGRIWGLGGATLDMGGLRAFGMGGDIPGYHAFFIGFLDNKLIVTALCNTEEGNVMMPSMSALQYISQSLSGASDESAVAFTPSIVDAEGTEVPGSIAVIETVTLGGVEQTITIRGANTTKPVLLFLHGGPGLPTSPWATWNNVHADLEDEFVLVHWDQRGAGKSFSGDLTADDMHVENFVSDTLELTDILRERFNQEKIFLWGHSWGSGLGFETLRVNSEPYYAFIASAVRPDWNSTQKLGYEKMLELAYLANNTEAIQALESIRPFDPHNSEHVGMRRQYMSQYLVGDLHTEGLEKAWLEYVFSDRSPEYPAYYIDQTLAGMEFSRQTLGREIESIGYDHARDFPVSTIPVYFVHGRYDYECPGELAEIYYDTLRAPVKEFIWFEDSAHSMYIDEPGKFNQELIRISNEVLASVQTDSHPAEDQAQGKK